MAFEQLLPLRSQRRLSGLDILHVIQAAAELPVDERGELMQALAMEATEVKPGRPAVFNAPLQETELRTAELEQDDYLIVTMR